MGFLDFLNMDAPRADISEKKRGPAGTVLHLYTSKLSKNITTNIIFLICNIPSIIIAFIASMFALPYVNSNLTTAGLKELTSSIGLQVAENAAPDTDIVSQLFVMIAVFVTMFLVGMTLVSVGPIQTTLASIYRNYARRKPVMLWSDFITTLKKEWRQSLVASIITFVLTTVIVANIAFYNMQESSTFIDILFSVFIVLFVFLMCIQMYVYPMIASVDLKILQIYRNAAILFIARFPQTIGILLLNILILAVIPAIMIFSFSSIGMVLAMLYYGLFAFSFTHLMNTVFVWAQIERFMVRDEEPVEDESSSQKEETVTAPDAAHFADNSDSEDPDTSQDAEVSGISNESETADNSSDSGDSSDSSDSGDTGDSGDSSDSE